jgi:hypothetical protein
MEQDKAARIAQQTVGSILKSIQFKIDSKEAIHYLWDDYKMRQGHYWASFNRFGLAIITVLVLPYIKPENMKPLGRAVILFPIIGLVLSVLSMWLLGAEYQRLQAIKLAYDYFLLGDSTLPYRNKVKPNRCYHRLFGRNIGYPTVFVFGVSFTLLSVASMVLLSTLKIGE